MGSSIVLKSLSILLGVFFIFVGITKLTPFISKELHKDLVSGFRLLFRMIVIERSLCGCIEIFVSERCSSLFWYLARRLIPPRSRLVATV